MGGSYCHLTFTTEENGRSALDDASLSAAAPQRAPSLGASARRAAALSAAGTVSNTQEECTTETRGAAPAIWFGWRPALQRPSHTRQPITQ